MIAQLDSDYIRARPARAVSRLASYALFEGRPLTTRGRWINSVVSFTAPLLGKWSGGVQLDRPVFILGTGRSGTTILGKILSLHRDIGFLNEPKLLWHMACANEDINGNYTTGPASYRLDRADATAEVVENIRSLYKGYLRTTGNARILDKYPELIFRTEFVRNIFPDAQFLVLVRNGVDTINSIRSWSNNFGQDDGVSKQDWWGRDDRKWLMLVEQVVPDDPELGPYKSEIAQLESHLDRAAVEWTLTMREVLKLRGSDSNVLELRYEELAQEPVRQLSEVFTFCDLSADQVLMDYARSALRYRERERRVDLHSAILPAFSSVMAELGYESL